jgi:hypothetical protein
MDKSGIKERLISTHSQRYLFLLFRVFIPFVALCFAALIVMGMLKESLESFKDDMYLALISIPVCSMILACLIIVIVPIIVNPIDKKKHGTGTYTAKFDCDFTDEKRFNVTHLLSALGFMVNEQREASGQQETLYFTKSFAMNNSISCCHITLCRYDGNIEVAAYLSYGSNIVGSIIGLYGVFYLKAKLACRMMVAFVLNALEAPREIKV